MCFRSIAFPRIDYIGGISSREQPFPGRTTPVFDGAHGPPYQGKWYGKAPLLTRRILQVGLDEAGYAPTLGPLVVTRVRLERPAAPPDLYERLSGLVSRKRAGRAGRGPAPLHVTDSKKVHNSSRGVAALERSILPFLRVALAGVEGRAEADGLTDLGLAGALSGGGVDIRGLDWYAGAPEALPVAADPCDVDASSERLAGALGSAGLSGLDIRSRVVTARELNLAIAGGLNKAEFLVEVVAGLIAPLPGELAPARDAGTAPPPETPREATVLVDRMGGRRDYRALLGLAFPGASTRELSRGERLSSYSVEGPAGEAAWRCGVTFACGAEDTCMTVALASMVSKYVRELLMARLNRWFAARIPGLEATAGYPVDARRFLRDTAALRECGTVADDAFIRAR